MKISCKFATSPDNLVANGKNLVTNATVLVPMSSPDQPQLLLSMMSLLVLNSIPSLNV